MRAATSSTAAASGVLLFLLSLPVFCVTAVQGRTGWSVTYTSTQICALKESTVTIGCSFTYPSQENGRTTTLEKRVWFINGNDYDPVDLETDSEYAGRVTCDSHWNSCTLKIRDLRESDSALYKFRFETDQDRGGFTGLPGVTLSVTALQVHVGTSSYPNWAKLTCQSSCRIRNHPSYIWYKNGQKIYGQTNMYWNLFNLNPSDSYSCAASGDEAFPSPSVCVQGDSCNRVNYSNRSICALKGSSVDISCTYNSYYKQTESKSWFSVERGYRRGNPSEDLRKVSQHEGRVEVIDTERGRSTLRIRDLRESDSNEYRFKFKTRRFEWTSSFPGTTLTVTDVQVRVTGRRLNCVTSCNPHVSSYVWYKNGQEVDGANSPSYEIYEESYEYKNSYSCALKGFENFRSPLICHSYQRCNRVNYVNRSICALKGSSVQISSFYNNFGLEKESKFWFRSGRESEDLSEVSQYEGRVEVIDTERGRSTLRIRDLRESDSNEYRFKFKSQSFEWTSSLPGTTLTVTDVQVRVTGRRLNCVTSCNPHVSSYVWYKNGQEVDGANSPSYEISYEESYEYKNSYSCALKGFENFRSPLICAPKVVSAEVNYSGEIMEGSSVTLTCSSDANPAPNYTWYKEQILLSRQQQFFISSVNSSHSGEYHCIAVNELGNRSSGYISVSVKYAPKLPSVSVSPSVEIVEGSSVTLTCSSDANPAANYTWYKENKVQFHGSVGEYNFSVHSEDRGNYFCKAENQHGQANSSSLFIDVQCSVNSAAVGSITVLFLILLILSAIIVIRKKRSLTQLFSRERPNSKAQQSVCPEYDDPSAAAQRVAAEQQEDLCYTSVIFSKNQADPVYSNIKTTKPRRQNEESEEEAEYTLIKFSNGAQGLRGQQAVEDSSALYSTVNKNY